MAYVLLNYPRFKAFTANGTLAVGYLLYSFEAGTATPTNTYTDKELTVANDNPIVLNSAGEAVVYVGAATKLVLKTNLGVEVWTQDYVGVQQDYYLVGTTTPGTTNNNYVVTVTPALAALSDGLMLVMTPDVDNADTITSQAFTGTGINDGVFSGPYVGSTSGSIFTVEIDANGTPDTFKWKKDGGAWTTGVAITAALQVLIEGIGITFAETTGHTIGDIWAVTVETPARVNLSGLGNKIIYKNIGGLLKALGGSDMKQDIPATLVYSDAQDCFILNNPSDPVLESAIPSRIRKELTADYQVVLADRGTELSCVGPIRVTMPDAPDVPNSFFYIYRTSGVITIDFGTYDAYMPMSTAGIHEIELTEGTYGAVQLVTNGVDWHILTTTTKPSGFIEVITANDATWPVPIGVPNLNVLLVGGGGGGGGAGLNEAGSGGGGGSLTCGMVDVSGTTTVNIAIGAGGTAGAAGGGNGGAGGTTSFGAFLSATGGAGGMGSTAGHTGGAGGTNTLYTNEDGVITIDGYVGQDGVALSYGGKGGDSGARRGAGGAQKTVAGAGNAGGHYGGAGGGAMAAAVTMAGGAGEHGICIVWW